MNTKQPNDSPAPRRKIRTMNILAFGAAAALLAAAGLYLTGVVGECSANPLAKFEVKTVGSGIALADITEFYYTYSSSTNPPEYQRYRFYTAEGRHLFYHEKREGDHWPLREADITVSGTLELSEQDWARFFESLKGGEVRQRRESTDSGSAGPWLFLYWKGDRSKYQEYSFPSLKARTDFEELCVRLKEAQTKAAQKP